MLKVIGGRNYVTVNETPHRLNDFTVVSFIHGKNPSLTRTNANLLMAGDGTLGTGAEDYQMDTGRRQSGAGQGMSKGVVTGP
jgi:hypothetical protein